MVYTDLQPKYTTLIDTVRSASKLCPRFVNNILCDTYTDIHVFISLHIISLFYKGKTNYVNLEHA